jgi:D-alanine transaminase
MAEPLPLCHLNGAVLPLRDARISPLDRGFLFGDGVYEVILVRHGQARQIEANLARLARSLRELQMRNPYSAQQWRALIEELIGVNGGGELYVYLQVSRGAEFARKHAPLPEVEPTVFAFCTPLPPPNVQAFERGIACITAIDTRWARCDIKSVALLANVLLRHQAMKAGAEEAILLRDGWLTDASASSVYVIKDGQILVPPNSARLLPSTTRGLLEQLADANGIARHDVQISESQLRAADEIWVSAATRGVLPVTTLDGRSVGTGRPGPLWRRMHELLEAYWAERTV